MRRNAIFAVKAALTLSPLLTAAVLTAAALAAGGVNGWGVIALLAESLAVLVCLTGRDRDRRLLALGGVSLLAAGVFIALYFQTPPPQREDLTERAGTVSWTRFARANRGRSDLQFRLEDDDALYWLNSTVRPRGMASPEPGDEVRVLCAEKEDGSRSVYELTVNGRLVLDYGTARRRTRNAGLSASLILLLAVSGAGAGLLREGTRPARRPGPPRRKKRRKR